MAKNYSLVSSAVFLSLFIFASCFGEVRSKSFYCEAKAETDVWRMPIVEPFELVTADHGKEFWSISTYPNNIVPYFSRTVSIDSVAYIGKKIVFYRLYPERGYSIIQIEEGKLITVKSREELSKHFEKIENLILHSGKDLYKFWQQNRQMPWFGELGIDPCNE